MDNSSNNGDQQATTLAESANYAVWQDVDDQNEPVYHLELGMLTLHFYEDEWQELTDLFDSLKSA